MLRLGPKLLGDIFAESGFQKSTFGWIARLRGRRLGTKRGARDADIFLLRSERMLPRKVPDGLG